MRRQTVKRTGRSATEVFRIYLYPPWNDAPRYTTVSITRHGIEKAHRIAVDIACEIYGLGERSEVRRALLDSLSAYIAEGTNLKLSTVPVDYIADIEDTLAKEIGRYQQRKVANIIRG